MKKIEINSRLIFTVAIDIFNSCIIIGYSIILMQVINCLSSNKI